MGSESQGDEISPFAKAIYAFLRETIDSVDIKAISNSEFATLLDLKKNVDALVEQRIDRWLGK